MEQDDPRLPLINGLRVLSDGREITISQLDAHYDELMEGEDRSAHYDATCDVPLETLFALLAVATEQMRDCGFCDESTTAEVCMFGESIEEGEQLNELYEALAATMRTAWIDSGKVPLETIIRRLYLHATGDMTADHAIMSAAETIARAEGER